MSRFEERREYGTRQMLTEKKVKVAAGMNVVHLEAMGDDTALFKQRALYYREGYDDLHKDESGIFMQIPKDESDANDKRYKLDAEARMTRMRKDNGGVPGGVSTLQEMRPVSAADFLTKDDKDDE